MKAWPKVWLSLKIRETSKTKLTIDLSSPFLCVGSANKERKEKERVTFSRNKRGREKERKKRDKEQGKNRKKEEGKLAHTLAN